MKNILLVGLSILLLHSCKNEASEIMANANIKYPETKKVDSVDTYFGEDVADPYRWLEDDRSAETEAWVKDENAGT